MAAPAFIPIGVDAPTPVSDDARERALRRTDLSAAWLAHALRDRGIEIDRIAAPQLIEQLLHTGTHPVDSVVCAALDADPAAAVNAAVATAFPQDVRLGVEIIARALNAARSVIVTDLTLRSPKLAGRRSSDNPRLVSIDHIYPQLHPTLLLKATLKRKLTPGRLPVEAGVLVLDAAAALTIARLAHGEGSPPMPMGVRDHRVGRSAFAVVAPELTIAEVFSSLRLITGEQDAVITGELLVRHRVELTASAGAAGSVLHVCACSGPPVAEPCVRCNWCADVCPTAVLPMLALEAAQFDDRALADRAGVDRCIGCGLCDYVCPSRLGLAAATHTARHINLPSVMIR